MSIARPKLPRKARLRGGAQFTGSFPWRRQGVFFTVLVRNNAAAEPARLGIIVSRRTAPLAVVRSYMKRIVREVFRHRRRGLGSVDVVIRIRRPAGRAQFVEARLELERLLAENC